MAKTFRRKIGDPQNLVSRSEPEITFASPEDHPKRVFYRATKGGFVATAPSMSIIMAIVFGGLTFFQGGFLVRSLSLEKVPILFYLVVGATTLITLSYFLFFSIGRECIQVKGEYLYLRRTVFGIGFYVRLKWKRIQHVRIRRRAFATRTVRAQTYSDGFSKLGTETVMEIETDKEIRMIGKYLRNEHLYYFRYLLLNHLNKNHPQAVKPTAV